MSDFYLSRNVLLGVTDEKINKSNATFETNKIGGLADWGEGKEHLTRCDICQKPQLLVTQVYCPFDDSPYHRILYVFCCKNAKCWSSTGGWSVFRQMITASFNDEPMSKASKHSSDNNWGDEDDNWGLNGDDWGDGGRIEKGSCAVAMVEDVRSDGVCAVSHVTDQLSLVNVNEVKDSQSSRVEGNLSTLDTVFESYYINVFDEADCKKWAERQKVTPSFEIDIGKTNDEIPCAGFASESQLQPEKYEKAEVACKHFHKFSKRNQICPEQVIRYCFDGEPLLARPVTETVTRCQCGSNRVYEMQLMPALIPYLVLEDISAEFSTVLIYTCRQNCMIESGLMKELVVYQDDPDLAYFKGQKR